MFVASVQCTVCTFKGLCHEIETARSFNEILAEISVSENILTLFDVIVIF
jgi:hypothetical protein